MASYIAACIQTLDGKDAEADANSRRLLRYER